jgi:hypothetical protein
VNGRFSIRTKMLTHSSRHSGLRWPIAETADITVATA